MIRQRWKGLETAPFFLAFLIVVEGCSIATVRPAQEMSNLETAVRAAREVNADVLAPELFRQALELRTQAKNLYQFRSFEEAKVTAEKARVYAEKAEFESLKKGGQREGVPEDPLSKPSYAPADIGPGVPKADDPKGTTENSDGAGAPEQAP